MKKRIPVLLVIAAVAAAGYYLYPAFFEKKAPSDQLQVSGNIETHESQLSFKVQGRIVELPIEEGQWVETGALIARLDDADFRQKVSIDEANLRVRESNLALTLAGTRQQEIDAARQRVTEAEADLAQKKLDFERAQVLFKKDAISAQDRDLAETALKRSQAAYAQAKERYNEAVEGSRKEEIAISEANVKQARANLGLSRINLDYTRLTAPTGGVISVRQAELGEVVSPGTPIVTLSDLDHVWLRAYISETDLGKVKWGQDAYIRTDSYPGKTYHGRISFISPKAEFTPKSVQTFKERVTLVYRIKIDVDNFNHELKPGMPADAQIQLASGNPSVSPSSTARQ
jgi:HlyD family secretion protein